MTAASSSINTGRSTHSSTAIEGNPLTLEEVRALEEGTTVAAPARARREVLNYFAALRHVEKQSKKKRLTHEDIFRLHAIIAGEVMDQGEAGRYRTMRVRVGKYVAPPPEDVWASLYFAGTSLITIGFGDVTPVGPGARVVALAAGATGLVLVALAITLIFSLYASFQRREVLVVTLDSPAGAPPSGVQLLESMGRLKLIDDLPALFLSWEKWAAEVLDSHLAYPLLCFFRSSHDNESWVSALGALLDAATLCLTTVEGCPEGRAKLLLAIGAHLVEDVSQYFRIAHEHGVIVERSEFDAARSRLADAGWVLRDAERSWSDFQRIRGRYAGDLEGMAHFWAVPPAQWIGDRSVLRHATA